MTSCKLTALFITTIVSVANFYPIQSRPPVHPCAESCSCTSEDTDWGFAVNVQCGERNLTSVPITINNQPVYLLNVSFNALKTIEKDALLSYETVRYLYLQHCKIESIHEKAFQRLENLTEIDLASNHLTSISPNMFNGNQKLNTLILRKNNLGTLQWNTPILNGPSSLSFLDLQFCRLSNISSVTFSLLNLTFLDISRNRLELLNNDFLSSHENLKDVNLENNPWQCGVVFQGLMCWMHSKLALSHNRTVKCQYLNGTFEIWSPKNRSSLCDSESTQSVTSSHKPDISTSTKLNLASIQSHEPDISTSTKLNLINTPSYKPDISTSTKLNLTNTPSYKPDISTSTKLNLTNTPSYKPDISTSTKLNLASTTSHNLDISTSTTLNPKVSHKAKPGTNSALYFWGMIFVVFPLLAFAFAFVWWLFCVSKKYSTQYREREILLSHSENAT